MPVLPLRNLVSPICLRWLRLPPKATALTRFLGNSVFARGEFNEAIATLCLTWAAGADASAEGGGIGSTRSLALKFQLFRPASGMGVGLLWELKLVFPAPLAKRRGRRRCWLRAQGQREGCGPSFSNQPGP